MTQASYQSFRIGFSGERIKATLHFVVANLLFDLFYAVEHYLTFSESKCTFSSKLLT